LSSEHQECEAERLIAELARRTGESKTDAVVKAVRDRLARIRGGRSLVDELEEIAERCSRLPVRDGRSASRRSGAGASRAPGVQPFRQGRDVAGLNYGGCFAYALATVLGEPLLFKGDDFIHTDVARAVRPAGG
jgi:uncharacterized protein with PIN domain